MALADNALTTLATVKTELGITVTTFDTVLERIINTVSEQIENYTKRKFKQQEHTEKYTGTNTLKLLLNQYPVSEVDEVIYKEESYTDYEIDYTSGILVSERIWEQTGISKGLSTRTAYPKADIEVTYTAGYILPKDATEESPRTLPYDLEDACIEAVTANYLSRGQDKSIVSERLMSASYTYDRATGMPVSVIKKLAPYRKIRA